MATIRHHARIARKPDEVWPLVSDPVALQTWFPGITGATVDGDVRIVSMGDLQVEETIVTNDAELRRFQYSITGGPIPVEHHIATIDVLDDGDGSLVVYSSDVRPDDLKAVLDPALGGALAGLKAKLEG